MACSLFREKYEERVQNAQQQKVACTRRDRLCQSLDYWFWSLEGSGLVTSSGKDKYCSIEACQVNTNQTQDASRENQRIFWLMEYSEQTQYSLDCISLDWIDADVELCQCIILPSCHKKFQYANHAACALDSGIDSRIHWRLDPPLELEWLLGTWCFYWLSFTHISDVEYLTFMSDQG